MPDHSPSRPPRHAARPHALAPLLGLLALTACGASDPGLQAPLLLQASPGAGRQVSVTWAPVADARLDHYLLYQRRGAGPLELAATVAKPGTGRVLPRLQPGDTYGFAVEAVDAAGQASPRSAEVAVTMPATAPQTALPKGTDGAPSGAYEYLPPGYGDGVPRPLLVFWHGFGENGDGLFLLDRVLANGPPRLVQQGNWPASRPFVVLSPQNELDCPTAAKVHAFFTWAMARYTVDPKQVFLTGLSCGSIGSWDYLGTHTDTLVAAALLLAGRPNGAWTRAGCDLGKVAIWAIHGTADPIVEIGPEEAVMASLAACPTPPRREVLFTPVQGAGHDVWSSVYSGTLGAVGDPYAWLLAHAKP
ncbi:MAG: hypothetical protein IPO09_04650 [Anaeromyxobacter sp.]|nr:hypothetical protein [Anaeromyxobacter sp.]MBL0275873.1 hypothetical protein [Anaeromyxobacter sp.]